MKKRWRPVLVSCIVGIAMSFGVAWVLGNVRGIWSHSLFQTAQTESIGGGRTITVRPADSAKYYFTVEPRLVDYEAAAKKALSESQGGRVLVGSPWRSVDWSEIPRLVRGLASPAEARCGVVQGFPFRCHYGIATGQDLFDFGRYRGLLVFGRGAFAWTMPYFVHWPLFLLNSVVYGGICFGVWAIVFRWRKSSRSPV